MIREDDPKKIAPDKRLIVLITNQYGGAERCRQDFPVYHLCNQTVYIYLKNKPETTAFELLFVLVTRICTWPDSCQTRYSPL